MDQFKLHLDKFITLSTEDFSSVMSFFKCIEVKKKQNLMTGGETCRSIFFVVSGCLRKFFINSKGVEQTTEFAIENWWITDTFAFERQIKSDFTVQAVEKSLILVLDYHSQQLLFEKHPQLERYFRMVYQRAYAASERRIRYLYEFSREDCISISAHNTHGLSREFRNILSPHF